MALIPIGGSVIKLGSGAYIDLTVSVGGPIFVLAVGAGGGVPDAGSVRSSGVSVSGTGTVCTVSGYDTSDYYAILPAGTWNETWVNINSTAPAFNVSDVDSLMASIKIIDDSNLQAAYFAGVGNFQDTAKTTVATADTNPVAYVLDHSGRGRHLQQGTGANRPTLNVGANGIGANQRPSWTFNAASKALDSVVADWFSEINGQNGYTVYAVYAQGSDTSSVKVLFGTGTAQWYFGNTAPGSTNILTVQHGGTSNQATIGNPTDADSVATHPSVNVDCFTFQGTGGSTGQVKVHRNNYLAGTFNGIAQPALSGTLRIGDAFGSTSFSTAAKIGAILIYKGCHSDATRRRIQAMLGAYYGINTNPILLVYGNSIPAGYKAHGNSNNAVAGARFTDWFTRSIGSTRDLKNFSLTGQSVNSMVTGDPVKGHPWLLDCRKQSVALFFEFSNYLNTGANTAANAIGFLSQWIASQRTAGTRKIVVISPMLRAGGSTDAGYAAKARAVAEYLSANWQSMGADDYVDVWNDPLFMDTTNTRIFDTDQIHLTAYGQMQFGERVRVKVAPYFD